MRFFTVSSVRPPEEAEKSESSMVLPILGPKTKSKSMVLSTLKTKSGSMVLPTMGPRSRRLKKKRPRCVCVFVCLFVVYSLLARDLSAIT